MKKVVFSLLSLLLLVAIICCDDNDYPMSGIALKNFSNTGCKSVTRAVDSDSTYFELKATDGNMLYVKHVNVWFNCSYSNFDAKVEIDGNSITIKEYAISENSSGIASTCICPFDLGYEIGPLKDGESYSIKVINSWQNSAFNIVYSTTLSKVIGKQESQIKHTQ